MPPRISRSSTLAGRCRVTRMYSPFRTPKRWRMSRERAAWALCSATSYITSPTRCTPRPMPSLTRLSTAVSVGQKRSAERWSATTRLISSGIDRLNDRRPASTCPRGRPIFDATSAPASVEFVSPYTRTRSGFSRSKTSSRPYHLRRLAGVTGASDAEVVVRSRHVEDLEEHVGHVLVIMLARMDENLLVMLANLPAHRCGLDELRACSDDARDFHGPQQRAHRI